MTYVAQACIPQDDRFHVRNKEPGRSPVHKRFLKKNAFSAIFEDVNIPGVLLACL